MRLFYILLNRNQRNFFCTYFFCNKLFHFNKIKFKKNQGSTSGNKNNTTHCVLTDIVDILGSRFQRKGWQEWKQSKANVSAASSDNSVILKLKIVFNLCLCSFFKRTRNRATETSTATIPKMRISHNFCFSSLSPLARLKCL